MRKQYSEKQSEEINPSTGLAALVDAVHSLCPILTETTLLRLSL